MRAAPLSRCYPVVPARQAALAGAAGTWSSYVLLNPDVACACLRDDRQNKMPALSKAFEQSIAASSPGVTATVRPVTAESGLEAKCNFPVKCLFR